MRLLASKLLSALQAFRLLSNGWRLTSTAGSAHVSFKQDGCEETFYLQPPTENSFANQEFKALGITDKSDELDLLAKQNVLELLSVFEAQGHSGFSAPIILNWFDKLARFEPLTPLTGEDWEWSNVSEASGCQLWQNTRCPRVFKDATGNCWDIEAIIFKEPSGACYTCKDSRQPVVFPYVPKTQYKEAPIVASVKLGLRPKAAEVFEWYRQAYSRVV